MIGIVTIMMAIRPMMTSMIAIMMTVVVRR
jgi:hypothetical protein